MAELGPNEYIDKFGEIRTRKTHATRCISPQEKFVTAATVGDLARVKALLRDDGEFDKCLGRDKGSWVHLGEGNNPVLHLACFYGRTEVVRFLLGELRRLDDEADAVAVAAAEKKRGEKGRLTGAHHLSQRPPSRLDKIFVDSMGRNLLENCTHPPTLVVIGELLPDPSVGLANALESGNYAACKILLECGATPTLSMLASFSNRYASIAQTLWSFAPPFASLLREVNEEDDDGAEEEGSDAGRIPPKSQFVALLCDHGLDPWGEEDMFRYAEMHRFIHTHTCHDDGTVQCTVEGRTAAANMPDAQQQRSAAAQLTHSKSNYHDDRTKSDNQKKKTESKVNRSFFQRNRKPFFFFIIIHRT